MTWETDNVKALIEGLILVAFALLLLSFSSALPSTYSLNYEIYPESNELTLQQGSSYALNVFYKLNTSQELPFYFDVFGPQGIHVNVLSRFTNFRDFTLPLYIKVDNIALGTYSVTLVTRVLYGGLLNERQTLINITVVPKEKVVFNTSNFTNSLPQLVLKDISTRNLLMSTKETQTVLLKFKNTGSASTFLLNSVIDSQDKNKVHIEPNTKYFYLEKNEERNILLTVELDENYAIVYTPIYLYVQEQSTGNHFDLGQINLTLKTQDILIAQDKNLNSVEITNIGTDIVSVDVNTNVREFAFLLQPNQTYFLQSVQQEKDMNIYLDGNLYKTINIDQNIDQSNLDQNKDKFSLGSSVAGLFSFGSGSTGWIVLIIVVAVLFIVGYKLFFARSAVFGKTIYVKDLKSAQKTN